MASRILDRRAVTFGLAGALCMPSILRAQANYPDRPINVIVPFAAGGPTDAIARVYAEFLSRDLGQTLVIENVAGAGGTIGSTRAGARRLTAIRSRSARPARTCPVSGSTRT